MIRLPPLLMMALFVSGCSYSTTDERTGMIRHYVIGFGVVSMPTPKAGYGVSAVRVQSLGLSISNQPGLGALLGYQESTVIAIPGDAVNVLVEVSQDIDGPIIIDAHSSMLKQEK